MPPPVTRSASASAPGPARAPDALRAQLLYPPPAFHFKVEVAGIGAGNDVRFSDVSGLSMELATEELAEAGENRFIQKYPVRAKYPELVLKRGLLATDSPQGKVRFGLPLHALRFYFPALWPEAEADVAQAGA